MLIKSESEEEWQKANLEFNLPLIQEKFPFVLSLDLYIQGTLIQETFIKALILSVNQTLLECKFELDIHRNFIQHQRSPLEEIVDLPNKI